MLIVSYQTVRTPPSALTRPPDYEDAVSLNHPRATSEPLHTIEEEVSQAPTPDIPLNATHRTSGGERLR
jgi:hypothetical protein